jgi:succinyl-CoA synthetase beta subunit
MKLHEHQAKTIFADAGIPVPESRLATTVDEALDALDAVAERPVRSTVDTLRP